MQATYPRSRRNVHSLAQPTAETRGEGQARLRWFPGLSPPPRRASQPYRNTLAAAAFTRTWSCSSLSGDITPSLRDQSTRRPCRAGTPSLEGVLTAHWQALWGSTRPGLAQWRKGGPTPTLRRCGAHPVPSCRGVQCPGS